MLVPEYVEFTLNRLEQKGFCAYLVGGCVRDYLMSKTPYDYDITTNALPQQIIECFEDVRTLDVGIKHGTVALVFDKNIVEVTTFRLDGEYKDNRRPENVEFTDKIELDLARRDFTVNAIAYSKTRGFADPFSGGEDIKKKRIACVGNPDERFCEDALRIMRALRFSSVLDFEIEEDTRKAIFNNAHLLCNISLERINVELCKMLSGKNVKRVFSEYRDVLCSFLPEMKNMTQENVCKISSGLEKAREQRLVSLCVFFSFLRDGEYDKHTVENILSRLKFSKSEKTDVSNVLSKLNDSKSLSKTDVKKTVSYFGYEPAKVYYSTLMCLDIISNMECDSTFTLIDALQNENACLSISSLAIDGNDLINNTSIEKKNFGRVLEILLNEVIEEKTQNTYECLINRAKELSGCVL